MDLISFYVRCCLLLFRFSHVFRKFSDVKVQCGKNLVLLLKRSLNAVSAAQKYFLSGLPGTHTTASYKMFTDKHLLPSGYSDLFLQLHPWLLEVGWIIFQLWEAMTEPILLQQLWHTFIVFSLTIFDILWCIEKWQLNN